jgi:hypothetical protein
MLTSSLSPTREALSELLSLTDENGSPSGPTSEGDLYGEMSDPPSTSDRSAVDDLFGRVRRALGIEDIPEGSVSFSKWLHDGEEEYHLRYKMTSAPSGGRQERLIGQLDIGKALTFTRQFDRERNSGREDVLEIEVYQSRELESGATIKNETTWDDREIGPAELGTVVAFFTPALEILERENR